MKQTIITINDTFDIFYKYIEQKDIRSIYLVCGNSYKQSNFYQEFKKFIDISRISLNVFSNFQPNPSLESIKNGVELFQEKINDVIIAVGGGSAIDVAKGIKYFSKKAKNSNYWQKAISEVELIAIPTTAGSGSEATSFAVVYEGNIKLSLCDNKILPNTIIFCPQLLTTLPQYHKKMSLLDALCHGLESYWSINSTDKSKKLSHYAINTIIENFDAYFKCDKNAIVKIQKAAFYAGQAINISKTTAGHALSYSLTKEFDIAHGYAVALVNKYLFPFMVENIDKVCDPRGKKYLQEIFNNISKAFGVRNPNEAIEKFIGILEFLGIKELDAADKNIDFFVNSVSLERLQNSPIY